MFALICMVLDHIGEFYPHSPMWFRYIGRLSAPIFFYCSAWGLHYTHNQMKYIIRLYILGIITSLGNIIVTCFLKNEVLLSNNIFQTLFLGCVIVYLFGKSNTYKKRLYLIIMLAVQQIIAFALCAVFSEFLQIPRLVDTYMLYHAYGALFGSIIFTEGSISFVIFFIALYFLKDKKTYLSIFVLSFSLFLEVLIRRTYYMRGPISYLIPFNSYQWLMVFAIPFICMYNGKRGKVMKWFYYLFYPIHIWVFCIMSNR